MILTVDGAPGDKSTHANIEKKTAATEIEQLQHLLENFAGTTVLEKVTALLEKVTALEKTELTARTLLNGYKPDILSQALKGIERRAHEFDVHISRTLNDAYDCVIEESNGTIEGEIPEASLHVETAVTTHSPSASTPTQDPFLRAIISGEHQAQVKAREDEARRAHFAEQQDQAVTGRPDRHTSSRPKYSHRYKTWCRREIAAKAQPKRYESCLRKDYPFYHEDQDVYFRSEDYMRDRNAEEVGDWDLLEVFKDRAGSNISKEKAGRKERSAEGKFKKLLKKHVATEAKANKEYADKKRKAAIEAKATAGVAHKKRKTGPAASPKAEADKDWQTES